MELDKLLIAIIAIAMISTGSVLLIVDLTSRYRTPVSPTFNDQFNKMNQTYSLAEDITQDIKGASAEEGTESDWDIARTIIAGLNAVKVVFVQGIPTIFSTITGLGYIMPLPEFVIRGIQAMLMISVAFALVYLYFRYKNG